MLVKTVKPLGLQRQGEVVDDAWQAGKMDTVKEWCKKVRQLGVLVGVGTHIPEVIARIEEENWDVDFYSGCVYNRRRRPEEWRKALNGEIMEMTGDIYMQSDPAAHVQGDPADQEALLRVQDSGGGTDSGRAASNRPFARPLKASSRRTACTSACSRSSKTKCVMNAEIVHRILTKG